MAYAAVKGGEAAIDAAHAWLGEMRRGDPTLPEITPEQIEQQLGLAVDRVMAEGGCHDRALAARAIRQARGDLIEAAFLLRAFRTTLPRFGGSEPVETGAARPWRRISATYKDLPGGQLLGPTFDYTHRLLELGDLPPPGAARTAATPGGPMPRVTGLLEAEGLLAPEPRSGTEPPDLTREPLALPAERALRLQALARGDEGFLLALGYSTQRGFGNAHPFVAELRVGEVPVFFTPPEVGFAVDIGDVTITECQMVNQFAPSADGGKPRFTRGYGAVFGHNERKAIAIALLDRALAAPEHGEAVVAPAQDAAFVLNHCDNVEATGFLEHLKLPHHVDFQSECEKLRALRRDDAS